MVSADDDAALQQVMHKLHTLQQMLAQQPSAGNNTMSSFDALRCAAAKQEDTTP